VDADTIIARVERANGGPLSDLAAAPNSGLGLMTG
jgi:hypothetical protein